VIKLAKRLRKKISHKKKIRERKPWKRNDWLEIFPKEVEKAETLARVQPKIQKKILEGSEKNQSIGKLREKKVSDALQSLKEKGKIRDYSGTGELSYADLVKGVDFIFVYVESQYKICRFSVTGWKWVERHQKKHPEIPVLPIGLEESREFIEEKILFLKNGNKKQKHFCQ